MNLDRSRTEVSRPRNTWRDRHGHPLSEATGGPPSPRCNCRWVGSSVDAEAEQSDSVATVDENVVDCERASLLAQFWAAALDGYEVRAYDDAEIRRLASLGLTPDTDPIVMIDGPGPTFCFQQVSERKRAKNRVHVDLVSLDRRTEVNRLEHLGATVSEEFDDHTVMFDPEGDEYCVCDAL